MLEWEDTYEVHFDSTVLMGHGYDWFGWENLRWETHTPYGSFAIWPDTFPSGKVWSAYGGPDGLLAMWRFKSEGEAQAAVERWVERLRASSNSA